MISSNALRFLAVAGLGLGALAAPAEAAVFQASANVSVFGATPTGSTFSLPQYSGPGTIVGVNIAFSGSASAADYWFYETESGITVEDYSRTWQFFLLANPDPGSSFLEADVPAEYLGGSVPPCELLICAGPNDFPVISLPVAFSGSVDVSDFSDFAGSGSNDFVLFVARNPDPQYGAAVDFSGINVSATVTETIMTVPEPSTWAMVLIGFAIVGFTARHRRLAGVRRRAAAMR